LEGVKKKQGEREIKDVWDTEARVLSPPTQHEPKEMGARSSILIEGL